ncbi:hypothetical protein KKG41_01660 [Patescibacteria group bacterium]|nr:hypothetical protein [Patescibacteria group bacterium]MBU1890483.1 hypothetical protein [Patescibacteria group bacterium]
MNRKTLSSIFTISAILIVGLGALTVFVYLPNRQDNDESDVKGARTSNTLSSAIDYLSLEVAGLKNVERNIIRIRPYLSADETTNQEDVLPKLIDSRIELLNLKARSQGWTVPASANTVQQTYHQMLDEYISMYEFFHQAFSQELGQEIEADFSLVDAERSESSGNKLMDELKILNGELLKASGTKFVDSDSDTLPDVWEQIAGSDMTLVDTDDDGLTDAEEFNIYLTYPDQPDSDEDGFVDGVEVTGGYNPLGEGMLTY